MSNALKAVGHSIVSVILFGIPVLLGAHFGWENMTIGALLNAIYLHFAVIS